MDRIDFRCAVVQTVHMAANQAFVDIIHLLHNWFHSVCSESAERNVPVSVWTVCLDTYDPHDRLVPSSFLISNIFQGIIWFLLPSSLIIINDIAAYLGGFFFGRTPLIKLSPKKTWEGFIFGFVCTVISSFVLAKVMLKSDWLTCPRLDLSMGWITCERSEVFIETEHTVYDLLGILPPSLSELGSFMVSQLPTGIRIPLENTSLTFEPMLFHAGVLAVFASVIAPFAGFFASGFKRAFRVKDFAAIIPGHGGMTDRMDCQTLMAMFSYLYYFAFIRETEVDVASILEVILNLDQQSQLEIFGKLGNYLMGEHLLPDSFSSDLNEINHLNDQKYRPTSSV